MAVMLDKIDAVPVLGNDFNYPFSQWLAVLVDTLNEIIVDIQGLLNLFTVPSYALLNETVTLTTGLPTFTVADGSVYGVGYAVVGTGIPANSHILTIAGNTVTISANATTTGASALTFIPINGGDVGNGILLYDTTNNVYVGMQSGALVQFTTSAYP